MERRISAPAIHSFKAFYDPTYGCVISSSRQEKRLMKEHGHIDARDTHMRSKYEHQIKEARRKKRKTKYYFF
jgi:hypothetical protein